MNTESSESSGSSEGSESRERSFREVYIQTMWPTYKQGEENTHPMSPLFLNSRLTLAPFVSIATRSPEPLFVTTVHASG